MEDRFSDMQTLLRLAGVSLPADRLAVMHESYVRWLVVAGPLDRRLPYSDEPAVAFRPTPGRP